MYSAMPPAVCEQLHCMAISAACCIGHAYYRLCTVPSLTHRAAGSIASLLRLLCAASVTPVRYKSHQAEIFCISHTDQCCLGAVFEQCSEQCSAGFRGTVF